MEPAPCCTFSETQGHYGIPLTLTDAGGLHRSTQSSAAGSAANACCAHACRLDGCPFLVKLPAELRARVRGAALSKKRHHALCLVKHYCATSGSARGIPQVSSARSRDFCTHCDSEEHRHALRLLTFQVRQVALAPVNAVRRLGLRHVAASAAVGAVAATRVHRQLCLQCACRAWSSLRQRCGVCLQDL
jgi:hypothetical protein